MATTNQSITEADILSDIIAPDNPGMTPEAARAILDLHFGPKAIARMDELAEKNRRGLLDEPDRDELEKYVRVGTFLNLMQAKARIALANQSSS